MAREYRSQHPRIWIREHPHRRWGRYPDKYIIIKHRVHGKALSEGFGWTSEGYTLDRAAQVMGELQSNKREGAGPVTLRDYREAMAEATREQELEAQRNGLTFADLAALYLAWIKHNKATWIDDERLLRNHLLPALGVLPLDAITTPVLNDLKVRLMQTRKLTCKKPEQGSEPADLLAPATVNHCLGLVRSVFYWAIEQEPPLFLGRNPARLSRKRRGRGVRLVPQDNKRLRVLTPKEEDLLLDMAAASSMDMHDMILLSLDTGLRLGEIVVLRAMHVMENGVVRVMDPKGEANRTVYPLRSRSMVLDRAKKTGGIIFPGRRPGVRRDTSVTRQFNRYCDRLGLNNNVTDRRLKLVFHSLRHTYGTRKYIETRDIELVKRLMGHEDIRTTERYVHLADELMCQMAHSTPPA